MKTIKLNSEREVLNYLLRLREQEEPVPAPAPTPDVPPAPPADAAATPGGDQAVAPAVVKPITVEDVIDKLNIVRSGKSTKDSGVRKELEEYVAQFTEEEKTALIAFLEGMGQILTSGIDSSVASNPEDPYSLQVQKIPGAVPKKSLVANPTPPAPVKPPPAPVPIKVGG